MANRESMREVRARLDGLSSQAIAPWQAELSRIVANAEARPVTRLVRYSSDGAVRVYEGWRAVAIAAVLDACAQVDGQVWFGKSERVGARGQTYYGYETRDGAHQAWRQKNMEAAKANSRMQANRWRVKAREQWLEYCRAYADKFPGSMPIGFDRWCRGPRAVWLQKGAEGIAYNEARGMYADIVDGVAEYLAKR